MSSEYSVSDDVKELIGDIIKKNKWEPVSDVKYYPGTEAGDGYVAKHVAVDIIKEDKTIQLFVKCALNSPLVEKIYVHEASFYDVIYPAYEKFLKKKKVSNCFRNVSKCYGISTKNAVALENLKGKGYALFDRRKIMNGEHIEFVLRTFAKLHAASFAFKDQEREKYYKIINDTKMDFIGAGSDGPAAQMIGSMVTSALSQLDAVADKHLIEKCDVGVLSRIVGDTTDYSEEYCILTQGDCWCNNVMFSYKNGNKECPTDVILVDWQMFRSAPPVLDVSYFFYTIASEESLKKLDFYLKVYYSELYYQIQALGSDPNKLYPFSVFEQQWKKYCKYGFAMAFMVFKVMLIEHDEVPDFEDLELQETQKANSANVFNISSKDEEYIRRIKVLGEFLIKNDYL